MNREKVWFITGASSGLGRAFAEYALQKGYCIAIGARRIDRLQQLVARAPSRVLAVPLDVNSPEQVETAVSATLERFQGVDVLFNNAGYGIVGAIEETPESELRAQMETNFFGALKMIRAFLPVFRSQRSGAIVNISSLGGQLSVPGFGAYSASKFALEGASEALAEELKPFGIKVLIVEPGQFRTELAGPAMKHMPASGFYDDTVGKTRDFAHSMDGKQTGDPLKAARIIDFALRSSVTPLRLQLGEDAVSAIRAHSEALLSELSQWEALGADMKIDRA
jgi:NAD(P)-dependent dehydrogenase (short-subunit alcohol dehydrogenase family)